jgi:hypothetical protein
MYKKRTLVLLLWLVLLQCVILILHTSGCVWRKTYDVMMSILKQLTIFYYVKLRYSSSILYWGGLFFPQSRNMFFTRYKNQIIFLYFWTDANTCVVIKEKSYIVCIKKVQEIVYLPVLFIYFSLIYFLQYIYMWMEFILFDILLVNKTLLHYICSVNANHDTILISQEGVIEVVIVW